MSNKKKQQQVKPDSGPKDQSNAVSNPPVLGKTGIPGKGRLENLPSGNDESSGNKHFSRRVELLTVFLLCVTTAVATWQACLTRELILAENRPWVGISGSGHFGLVLTENEPLSVTMEAINTGKSPALFLSSVNKLETVGPTGKGPTFDEYGKDEGSSPVVLFPNAITTISIDTRKPSAQGLLMDKLTREQVDDFRSGKIKIYVYGSIWYQDPVYGRDHRTDYCFIYDYSSSSSTDAHFSACPQHNKAN